MVRKECGMIFTNLVQPTGLVVILNLYEIMETFNKVTDSDWKEFCLPLRLMRTY